MQLTSIKNQNMNIKENQNFVDVRKNNLTPILQISVKILRG